MKIVFYKNDNEKEPVRDWLKSLNKNDKKQIGEDLKTVQYGWPIGMPVVRKLESDLWEVRTHIKNGIARVFFTVKNDLIILLHGFIKKTDKTPLNELNTARQRNRTL